MADSVGGAVLADSVGAWFDAIAFERVPEVDVAFLHLKMIAYYCTPELAASSSASVTAIQRSADPDMESKKDLLSLFMTCKVTANMAS